jgi:hypothetical protein
MTAASSAQLVTLCQRLATLASESGRNGLTFLPPCGQIPDGYEWSMAAANCAPSYGRSEDRGV